MTDDMLTIVIVDAFWVGWGLFCLGHYFGERKARKHYRDVAIAAGSQLLTEVRLAHQEGAERLSQAIQIAHSAEPATVVALLHDAMKKLGWKIQ